MKGMRIADLEDRLTEALREGDDSRARELEDAVLRKEKRK